MNEEDVAVYNKIMAFKNKVDYIKENPEYKSGEAISVDSAVWYLDATVNFTHAFAFESFDDFYTDSVFVEIPATNGEINMNDLSDGYFDLVDEIRDSIYSVVAENDKQLYSSSTKLVELENGIVQLKNTSTIGSKGVDPEPGTESPFDEGWMYGENAGSCNNPYVFSDAIHEIADATMTYKSLYITDEGEHWHAYYTQPEKEVHVYSYNNYETLPGIFVLLNPEDEFLNDNDRDRLMFYQNDEFGSLQECIQTDDMNFYYHGTHEVIYDIIPNNTNVVPDWVGLQGLTFNDITQIEGNFTGLPVDKGELFHHLEILYKTRHVIYDDEFPIKL